MARPKYPSAGAAAEDAVATLLPAGLAPNDARILWVHAHPDDESIATGGAMARYAHRGAANVLLTMTRGERGEVIPEPLRHLEVGRPGCPDTDGTALGRYRVGELEAAAAALSVSDRFFAGEAPALDESVGFGNGLGRYLDSGMSWGADGRAEPARDVSPAALTSASVEEAAAHVAAAIRAVRPHVVVTYCDDGGYGHPDHVRTHHVTLRAVELAAEATASSGTAPVPATATAATAGTDPVAAAGEPWRVALVWGTEGGPDPADRRSQAAIEGDPGAKRAAMAAHATQIVLDADGAGFELSNGVPQQLHALETYRLLRGELP